MREYAAMRVNCAGRSRDKTRILSNADFKSADFQDPRDLKNRWMRWIKNARGICYRYQVSLSLSLVITLSLSLSLFVVINAAAMIASGLPLKIALGTFSKLGCVESRMIQRRVPKNQRVSLTAQSHVAVIIDE